MEPPHGRKLVIAATITQEEEQEGGEPVAPFSCEGAVWPSDVSNAVPKAQ